MIEHESVTIWGQAPVWWLPACNLSPSQHICLCVSFFTFPNTEDQFQHSCDIIGLFGRNVSKSLGWLCHFDTLGISRPMGGKTQQDPGVRIQSGRYILMCNLTSRTRGPNQPPLVQKTLRDEHRAPTDLLWCKNRYMTNTGPQPTSFDAENVTWRTRALTDLLWCKKDYLTNTGPQPTFYMFRYYGRSHYPCMMASRFTGIHQKIWICDRKGPWNCVFRPNSSPNDRNIKTKCFFCSVRLY